MPNAPAAAPSAPQTFGFLDGSSYKADQTQVTAPVQSVGFLDGSSYNPKTGAQLTQKSPPVVLSSDAARSTTQNSINGFNQAIGNVAAANANAANNPTPAPTPAPSTTTSTTPAPSTTTSTTPATTDNSGSQPSDVGPANSAPTDYVSQATQQLAQVQAQTDQEYANYKQQVASINNGTLTADEQAQINLIQASIDRQTTAMQQANNAQLAGLTMAGIRNGTQRYTAEDNIDTLAGEKQAGLQRITDIQNQGLQLIQQARSAMQQNDLKALNDAYTAFQQNQTSKTQAINDMVTLNQKAEDLANTRATQALAQLKENQAIQQGAQKFAADNNIQTQFYELGGNVYDTATGQQVPNDMATATSMGVKPDFSNVTAVDTTKHSSSYTEWQDYKSTGGKLNFNDYLTMDANRKATKVTNTTYNQSVSEAQTQASAAIGAALAASTGKGKGNPNGDNYVSPDDWQKGLQKWTKAGYSAADYNKQFMNYLNPADLADYGVTK